MSESTRCERCGAGLSYVGERAIGPDHVHRDYECPGCLGQFSACSREGYALNLHSH